MCLFTVLNYILHKPSEITAEIYSAMIADLC